MTEAKERMRAWEGLSAFGRWSGAAEEPSSGKLGGRQGGGGLFFFDTQGARLEGRAVGAASAAPGDEGPLPIVLIHGLGDEADSFRHLLPLLSPRHRVLAPDLPGFGRSAPGGRVSFRSCLAAITGLLEAEVPGGCILVGSSLGAAIAEELSFRRPDLAKGLVLVDGGLPTPPAGGGGLAANLLPGLGESRYRAFRGRPEAAYASLEPYYADISALGAEDRVFLAERVVERVESESQLRAYFSLFRSLVGLALFGRSRQKRLLAASPTPLLILWGREDSIIPCEGALFLAGIAPRARVAILDHCGHLPHQEAPEAVAREILDFARSQVL